eukprot:gene4406-5161_t
MDKLKIEEQPERWFIGLRSVGPYEKTVKAGFDRLEELCKSNAVETGGGDSIAIYYDNPEKTPHDKLKVDTVITVAEDFVLPTTCPVLVKGKIDKSLCAIYHAEITDLNFPAPWKHVYCDLLPQTAYVALL